MEKLKSESGVSPHVQWEQERFGSITNHILKARLESDEWHHTDDSVLFHTLCRRRHAIEQARKHTICILRNIDALM